MHTVAGLFLWTSVALLGWTWAGYPTLLAILRLFSRRRPRTHEPYTPEVTVMIAAHNEEAVIARRLQNVLDQDYPATKLNVVIAADRCTDRTAEIVRSFDPSRVTLVNCNAGGKSPAQNEAMPFTRGEIIVLSDSDTDFAPGFVSTIVEPFSHPDVGGTTGKLIWQNPGESAVAEGNGLYWRFEHWMWIREGELGLLAWGSGACMALRRALFRPMPPQYGDDCIIPLDIVEQGYRMEFVPDAMAYEPSKKDAATEIRNRTRMTLRGLGGTLSRTRLLNPFRHPLLATALWSHKILRWLTSSLMLIALVSNLLLVGSLPYNILLLLQLAFYVGAGLGFIAEQRNLSIPVLRFIAAFCVGNVGMFLGTMKLLAGHSIHAYRFRDPAASGGVRTDS